MSTLGSIDVSAATVGTMYTFNVATPLVNQATIGQQRVGLSDQLIINNLSGCVFSVVLQPSGRGFTFPAGVPSNPIPLSFKGISDSQVTLTVQSVSSIFPSKVFFDWFAATEPILYVGSSAASTGNITLTAISTSSITFPSPHNWVIQEDGSGNLDVTDTTTGHGAVFTTTGGLSTADTLFSSTALSTGGDLFTTGPYAQVGGQNTVGSLGVPAIVAQKIRQTVSSTSATTILTFTVGASAESFEVNGYFNHNATSAANINFNVTWTDPTSATPGTHWFITQNAGTGASILLNGSNSVPVGQVYATDTAAFDAKSSSTITVQYTSPAASPNDIVTCTLKRIG